MIDQVLVILIELTLYLDYLITTYYSGRDQPKGGRNQLEPTGTEWMSDNTRQDDPTEVKRREGLIDSVRDIINYINTHTCNGVIERTSKSTYTPFLFLVD